MGICLVNNSGLVFAARSVSRTHLRKTWSCNVYSDPCLRARAVVGFRLLFIHLYEDLL